MMQNLLSLLGLQAEEHPQRDPRLTITCMKMETAQNAADFVHETLQSMPFDMPVDVAAFQSTLADYAAYMQYAALLRKQLDQAGVQESEYRPMLDRCFAASPARDLLDKPCHDFLYISGAFRRLYPVGRSVGLLG